ncbi:ABHD17A, partial [Symbiodinium pilosum]
RVTESDTPITPKSHATGAQSSHATGTQSSQVTGAQSSQVTGAQSSQVTGTQSSQVTGAQSSQVTGGQADQTASVQTAQSTGAHSGVQQYAQVRYTSARPSQELVDASYGWQTLESSGHFIWRGLSDHFIDPSLLVPITWPYRTTLVYVDDGWKVLELCVAWQSLKDPIAFLPCGEAQCMVVLSSGEEDPSMFGVEVLGEVIQNSGFQDSDAMLLDDEPCVDAPAGASEPQEFAPALPEPVADQMEHVPASVQTDSNEPVVVANGPVEKSVDVVRRLANVMLSMARERLGIEIGVNHPLFSWAFIHSAWCYSRYRVKAGLTAHERASGARYNGKLVPFAEPVYAYVKPIQKGNAKWEMSIFLGKSTTSDMFIVGTAQGIRLTKSVRRTGQPWKMEHKLAESLNEAPLLPDSAMLSELVPG